MVVTCVCVGCGRDEGGDDEAAEGERDDREGEGQAHGPHTEPQVR